MAETLADIPVGSQAVIVSIEAKRWVRQRLLELGLLPDTVVQLLGKAPWGDPLRVRLRGFELSLRLSEARTIHVRPSDANRRHTDF